VGGDLVREAAVLRARSAHGAAARAVAVARVAIARIVLVALARAVGGGRRRGEALVGVVGRAEAVLGAGRLRARRLVIIGARAGRVGKEVARQELVQVEVLYPLGLLGLGRGVWRGGGGGTCAGGGGGGVSLAAAAADGAASLGRPAEPLAPVPPREKRFRPSVFACSALPPAPFEAAWNFLVDFLTLPISLVLSRGVL
jgi:hypothetical protein